VGISDALAFEAAVCGKLRTTINLKTGSFTWFSIRQLNVHVIRVVLSQLH